MIERIEVFEGVSSEVGRVAMHFLGFLGRVQPVRAPVDVLVVPAPAIVTPDGGAGFGVTGFDPQSPRETGRICINIAGEPGEPDEPIEEFCKHVLFVIGHEYVHAVQRCKGYDHSEDQANEAAGRLVDLYLYFEAGRSMEVIYPPDPDEEDPNELMMDREAMDRAWDRFQKGIAKQGGGGS